MGEGTGVFDGVGVIGGTGVKVGVGMSVGVGLTVGTGVCVGTGVMLGVGVSVGVRVTVGVGKGIEFDSTCSSGNPVSTVWDVRYDAQSTTTLAQSEDKTYIHVFEEVGTYTISLTIRDQFGNTDKDSVTVTVTP